MYNYIKGKLVEILENKIVVETDGIGFDIFFPSSNFENLPSIGENVKVFTYMNVKEDEMSLYGFLTSEDKDMFLKLLTVNGVGPKGALNVISNLGFSTLMKAIKANDSKLIASVKGLGQKTASKICIELGDKVSKLDFSDDKDIIKKNKVKNMVSSSVREEVVEALKKLGYKEVKAREMLAKIDIPDGITAGKLLKLVLK